MQSNDIELIKDVENLKIEVGILFDKYEQAYNSTAGSSANAVVTREILTNSFVSRDGTGTDMTKYYKKSEVDDLLDDKANVSDVYNKTSSYNKTTIDDLVNNKADAGTVYSKEEITQKIKETDFKVTNLTWDTEVLRSSGDVVIGEGNNGTLKVVDNTGNTGTLIVGSNDGASTGVLIKSTNGTGEIKINGKSVKVANDSGGGSINVFY